MNQPTGRSEPAASVRTTPARVAVIGLGYVGLPLAAAFAQAGLSVVGLEIDACKVEAIQEGISYVADLSGDTLTHLVEVGRLRATTDPDALAEADAVIVCVPTPLRGTGGGGRPTVGSQSAARSPASPPLPAPCSLSAPLRGGGAGVRRRTRPADTTPHEDSGVKRPDLTHVIRAGVEIRERLRPGQLIVLESTTYPGTTQELLQPLLESSGRRCGVDFELAYSPERIDPGNPRFGLKNTPKIVAGVTPRARNLAAALYRHVVDEVVVVSEPRVAEMAKLLENIFRHVNIALANEMAILCDEMGIDIWEVIDAAATKPFGFMPFYPGPGVGGHCIPIDPFYFSWKCREHNQQARLVELAGEINDRMPERVVERVAEALHLQDRSLRGSRVLVLGVSYKKDVGDVRESPALKVIDRLRQQGAEVSYHDPHVPVCANGSGAMTSVALDEETLASADCVVVLTDHSCLPYGQIVRTARAVVDMRNALRTAGSGPRGARTHSAAAGEGP
jgi:UDP-N-acetyl-D-glucosamine dehydrogenase